MQGKPCTDPKVIAETFNEHYIAVPERIVQKLGKIEFDSSMIQEIGNTIYMEECTEDKVLEHISTLANKNSSGLDDISNAILKTLQGSNCQTSYAHHKPSNYIWQIPNCAKKFSD